MKNYHVRLESAVFDTYRCQRAANSLDIDTKKKSVHELNIKADLDSDYTVGLILGASGSGKTTLAKQIWGADVVQWAIAEEKPVIEQFPEQYSYDECAELLAGIGLTSVPCWIRPVYTLSNGQKARATAALAMVWSTPPVVIDEWTSVVDRTVAKVMSHCVQKFARKRSKKIVLLSCHYDVLEWLNPDWIIDCNRAEFTDRRLLQPEDRKRRESLAFDIRPVDRGSWRYFSKYHYLSDRLPGGHIKTFGLFHGQNQVGFQCFANYTPHRSGKMIMHSNRTVIHPDYAGLGMGIKLINETSRWMKTQGFRVMAKYSSTPVFKAMSRYPEWKLLEVKNQIGKMNVGGNMMRKAGFRENVKTYSFEFIG